MPNTETVKIQDLNYYYKNPRRGDIEAIANSLKTHGQYKTICVNKGTKTGRPLEILAGNHTIKAARTLGWETIQATIIDVDDEAAAKIVIADNRTSDLAENDPAILIDLIDSLTDLDGTGWADEELEELAQTISDLDTAETPEEPELTAPPAEPISTPGTIWQLGEHRLICGDATNPDTWDKLFGQERAWCIWTDPPYGIAYEGKGKEKKDFKNEGIRDMVALLYPALRNAIHHARPAAPIYQCFSTTQQKSIEWVWDDLKIEMRQQLYWVKNAFTLSWLDYQCQQEPIRYGYLPGKDQIKGKLGRRGSYWYGEQNAADVFFVDKPTRNREHPTMKPVDLIRPMVKNSCKPGEIVADPFAGSGSTLVAAHLENRRAYLIELAPEYCDVICRRYQKLTGQHPINQTTGEPYDFTTQEETNE